MSDKNTIDYITGFNDGYNAAGRIESPRAGLTIEQINAHGDSAAYRSGFNAGAAQWGRDNSQ